jgi:hypothetical protein
MAVLSCEFLERDEHNEGIRLVTQTVTLICPDSFRPPGNLGLDCRCSNAPVIQLLLE